MQKKEIKGKRTNSSKKKSNSTKSQNTKKRVTPKNTKLDNDLKIASIIAAVILLLLCYITLGIIFTIITALGLAIIIGVAQLLKKTKITRKKDLTIIAMKNLIQNSEK